MCGLDISPLGLPPVREHSRARAALPEISLATVYNTLNELVAMGEVRSVQAGDGLRRYDPNVASPHQHLHCVVCGTLWDVDPVGAASLAVPTDQQRGFEILGVDIVFRGRCGACAGDANSPGGAEPAR